MGDLRFSMDELFSNDPEMLLFVKSVTEPKPMLHERLPNAPPMERAEEIYMEAAVSEREEADPAGGHRMEKKRKIPRILSNILFYGAILGIFIAVFQFATSDDPMKSIMGYRYYEILTGSMKSVYPKGSVVIVKITQPQEIAVGDDITYYMEDGINTVTHRVIEVVEDMDGEGTRGFKTQGVDNPVPDDGLIDSRYMVGVVKQHVPYVGAAISYLSERIYLAVLLFVLIAVLVTLLASLLKKEPEKEPVKI